MDLGSCQYSDIGDTIDDLLYENLSTQLIIRKYPEIDFSKIGTWEEHLDGLRVDLNDMVLDNISEHDDAEDILDREAQLGTIQNMVTMDDFFTYACGTSWDLWSATSFICARLGIKVQDDDSHYGMFSNRIYGALLYYFHRTKMIEDMDVYAGFDT